MCSSLPFTGKETVKVDTTPYIRPLVELKDGYEGIEVIIADNKKARIFLVYTDPASSQELVRGNIKNPVKVFIDEVCARALTLLKGE